MKAKGQMQRFPVSREQELVRQELALQAARKRAERAIDELREEFPKKSLMQLLIKAVNNGERLAAQMLIERIELNQRNRLSVDEMVVLQQVKAQLAGRGICPAVSRGT